MRGATVTASRRQALRKLLRYRELRQGMGHWDDTVPVVSPAAAAWLVDERPRHHHARHQRRSPLPPTARDDAVTDLAPRPVTQADCHAWRGERLVLGTNPQGIGRPGLEVVLTLSIDEGTQQPVPHVCVPFTVDEISLNRLAHGGTLWVCLLGTSTVPLFVTTDPAIERPRHDQEGQ